MGVQFNPTKPAPELTWREKSIEEVLSQRITSWGPPRSAGQGVGSRRLNQREYACLPFSYSFDFIFCFSEINPYYFRNKKNNIGNFIGREIKVTHIELTSLYEANQKKNKPMPGIWLVKSPWMKFLKWRRSQNLPGTVVPVALTESLNQGSWCFLLADNSKKICAFVNSIITSSFCVF